MNFIKTIIILVLIITISTFIVFDHFRNSIFSIISSWVTPIDTEYVREREWLADTHGGIITFYDNAYELKHDTIYSDSKAMYKIKNLNKYFNDITLKHLETKKSLRFTSTEEFLK